MDVANVAVDTLVSVVYVSSAAKELGGSELTELLAFVRRKNKERGVTGMLLYRGGNFLQVIEGPESQIDPLLKVLKKDNRHTGMIVLKRTKIAERQFSEWQMAFRDITEADLTTMEGYSPFMELSFKHADFQAQPSLYYKLLANFKEKCR